MKKQNGFTMSEVLITLVIIAVVAGLVVPQVIKETNQMEFKAGYQRAINALNSALSEYNEGAIYCKTDGGGTIGFKDKDGVIHNAKNYESLANVKMSPNEQCFVGGKEITERRSEDPKSMGENGLKSSLDLYNNIFREHLAILKKDTNNLMSSCSSSSVYFYTADGMKYCIDYSSSSSYLYGESTYGVIWVDVNGDKRPNRPPRLMKSNTKIAFFDQFPIIIMQNRFIPGHPTDENLNQMIAKVYFGEE